VVAVTSERRAKKLVSKPQVTNFLMLDSELTLVESVKRVALLNKAVASGFQVLEASKHHMQVWWYEVLKVKYGDKIKLILSDTDSLVFKVYTEDVYHDLVDMKELMDMSPYSIRSGLHDPTNKKVVGKMSDEMPDRVISEVIALKPKMYAIRAQGHYETPFAGDIMETSKTAKGVPKAAKKKMNFDDYRHVLETSTVNTVTFKSIRGVKHENQTLEFKKRGLSALDDKRYILPDGINSLSYGHYSISE